MCCCFDKKNVAKKARNYNVNSRELNNASKRLVPYENIYGYVTTKYCKKPGDVSIDTVKQLESTFKKRYNDYMQYDLRLKDVKDNIIDFAYKCTYKSKRTDKDALEAAIQHIDFAFGECLFDKDLNKNNKFQYTDEEKYNIYKDIRGMMLQKFGFSLGR